MTRIRFIERLLARGAGSRGYAAVAGPHGVHVVQYERGRGGLVVEGGVNQTPPGQDPERLAASLAEAIEALGGGGGELSLALSGFETAHHILTLPTADEEILRPIVRRELLRYYPDLEDPVIDFVFGARGEEPSTAHREMLVGAVPRGLALTLSRSLRERGIVLRQLTVLPQVLQSLYDTFDGSNAPAVMVLVLDTGTLIGCFHDGALRLFIEPPHDMRGRPVRDPASVTEQVERANLFLRQQFPNTRVQRVLLAAETDEFDALRSALKERLGSAVTPLAEASPGRLAALGAALATDQDRALQLLPSEVRPRTPADRLTRRLAMVAAVLVAVAAVWWAGAGMILARNQAERAQALEEELSSALPELTRTSEVLEARRAHHLRLLFLRETETARAEVRRIMAGVAAATRPEVELEFLEVERSDGGWTVSLAGRSEASGSAAAVRAIDALYRGIPDRLPVVDAEFGGMEGVNGAADAPVAIAFDMSFIVLWQTNLAR